MTTIYNFPTIPVSEQLFYVPGGVFEGGYTAGAVRMVSPGMDTRSKLLLQVSLQTGEWENPMSSWLMSLGAGEVFRVRLAPTPQVLSAKSPPVEWSGGVPWYPSSPWSGDITAFFAADALEGDVTVQVDMTGWGDIARLGHVLGHKFNTYKIMSISFDSETNIATIGVKPPLRKNVTAGDITLFRPYFTGTISNISEVVTMYDAENAGAIKIGKIEFSESIV